MNMRYLAAAVMAGAIGCTSINLFHSTPSIFVRIGKTSADAKIGDVVDLEVGPGIADAANHGFRAYINDHLEGQSGWVSTTGTRDIPNGNLKFQFRPSKVGLYHVEVFTHYPGRGEEKMEWDITVKE